MYRNHTEETVIYGDTDSYSRVSFVLELQSGALDGAPGGVIFKEARHLLSLHFVLFGVAYTPRSHTN